MFALFVLFFCNLLLQEPKFVRTAVLCACHHPFSFVLVLSQSYRRGSSVFAGKQGFITLRDLFRWAERYRLAEQTQEEYDWLQHLANDGTFSARALRL